MKTKKLTLNLPEEDLEFAERYAQALRMTVSELVDRYFRHLRAQDAVHAASKQRQAEEAWREFFRVGDAIATHSVTQDESLMAAVVAMRR